jgi:hypothetical protein
MASQTHSSSDTVSVAKLGLYGTIGTAIISAVTTAVIGLINYNDRPDDTVSKGSPPSTTAAPTPAAAFTPTLSQKSDDGSFNKVQFDGAGGVTVSGVAEEYVSAVFVVIGPKPSGGYWYGQANVSDQHWQADVATDPPWGNYSIWASYWTDAGTAPGAPPSVPRGTSPPAVQAVAPAGRLVSETTRISAVTFTVPPEVPPEPTATSSPPIPDELVSCAVQFGPSCFTGPGFGAPSVYQPKQ